MMPCGAAALTDRWPRRAERAGLRPAPRGRNGGGRLRRLQRTTGGRALSNFHTTNSRPDTPSDTAAAVRGGRGTGGSTRGAVREGSRCGWPRGPGGAVPNQVERGASRCGQRCGQRCGRSARQRLAHWSLRVIDLSAAHRSAKPGRRRAQPRSAATTSPKSRRDRVRGNKRTTLTHFSPRR